jgi:hypothetical protein
MYKEPVAKITPDLDVFLPLLSVEDGTDYAIPGLSLQSVVRSWSGNVGSIGAISAGNYPGFDLGIAGVYYDADYTVSLVSIVNWVVNASTWVTVRDRVSKTLTYTVNKPPALDQLLLLLNDFKDSESRCNSLSLDYAYAESLYSHILKRGCYGLTSGLDSYVKELQKVLNGGSAPVYPTTELPLAPYSWESPCNGEGGAITMSNIGNGEGVFAGNLASNFRFKRLSAGAGIGLSSNASEIIITANSVAAGEINTAENVGANGVGLHIGKVGSVLRFRKINQGSGITIETDGAGEIVISATSVGEINAASNIGAGLGLFSGKLGSALLLKSLQAGANISITPSEDGEELVISSTAVAGGSNLSVENSGSNGIGVYKGQTGSVLQFRRLLGAAGVRVALLSSPQDGIVISGPGIVNVGTGEGLLYKSFNQDDNTHSFRRIKSGSNISVELVDDDLVISSSGGGSNVIEEVFTSDGVIPIPSTGRLITYIAITLDDDLPSLKIGTAPGGEDLFSDQPYPAGDNTMHVGRHFSWAPGIYFTGITVNAIIKVYYV